MGPSRSGHSTATDRTAPLVVAIDERAYPDEVQVDVDRWSDLARRALVELGIVGSAELTLTLVDPAAIATLNAEHLGGYRTDRRPLVPHRRCAGGGVDG